MSQINRIKALVLVISTLVPLGLIRIADYFLEEGIDFGFNPRHLPWIRLLVIYFSVTNTFFPWIHEWARAKGKIKTIRLFRLPETIEPMVYGLVYTFTPALGGFVLFGSGGQRTEMILYCVYSIVLSMVWGIYSILHKEFHHKAPG